MMVEVLNHPNHYGRQLLNSELPNLKASNFQLSFDTQTFIGSLAATEDGVSTYANYHSIKRDENYLAYFESLVRYYVPSGEILELGCNNGELLFRFSEPRYTNIGVDPTIPESKSQNVRFFEGYWGASFLSEADVKFNPDAIIARHVLEHVPDYSTFIDTINKVTKSSSVFFLEVPDFEANLKNADVTPIFNEHLHYFTLPGLQKLLNEAGWYIVEFNKFDYWGGSIILVLKRMGEVINLSTSEMLISQYVENFEVNIKRKHLEVYAELEARQTLMGEGIAMFGIGNRALHFLAFMPESLPVDFYFDNDPKKNDLIIPYQKKAVSTFEDRYLESLHTIFISAFGYEKNIVEQLSRASKIKNRISFILCDPNMRFLL